jgi:hypothetical protein
MDDERVVVTRRVRVYEFTRNLVQVKRADRYPGSSVEQNHDDNPNVLLATFAERDIPPRSEAANNPVELLGDDTDSAERSGEDYKHVESDRSPTGHIQPQASTVGASELSGHRSPACQCPNTHPVQPGATNINNTPQS